MGKKISIDSRRIRREMKRRKWTYEMLGKKLRMSRQGAHDLVNKGKTFKSVEKLAKVFDEDPRYFMW